MMPAPLVQIDGLTKVFASSGRRVAALHGVSLQIQPGETLGLVGPSGCGKSTLARVLTRLVEPDAGSIVVAGQDWLQLRGAALRGQRRLVQMVFQDPLAAFNPRARVADALGEPLRIHALAERAARPAAIARLLDRVGLPATIADRAVHEISGGQRQRVALARALACQPALIVLDEAVSSLDASIRGKILQLLVEVQREQGVAYLFISHDLAAVHALAHRVAVMQTGRIVETGPTGAVVANPQSAIAQALVAAVPRLRG